MNDTAVDAVFAKECWADKRPPYHRFCVSDEHQIPTLLAHLGLDGEADCGAVSHHARWDGPYFHPHTYRSDEVWQRHGGVVVCGEGTPSAMQGG